MMKKVSFLMLFVLSAVMNISAQTNIRYVSKSGAYANDGKSWASPKLNIQDAINDLVNNHLTGEVWVAAGTYTPTESTEASGGSTLYMSFKIPEGITVRGGFAAGLEKAKDGVDDETTRPKKKYVSIGEFYENHTVLSGNLSSEAVFTWNSEKKQWNTTFYGNCYHVVWFATKGFDSETGRAKAISNTRQDAAKLEGCVVTGGNAYNNSVTGRSHNAYGGGIYMVPGASVENCWIRNCSASRDGGGVYMDGGGYLEHCYVQDCQALGIGVQNGFGGGICVDGLEKAISNTTPYWQTNPVGFITRSGITGCVGRMGGGLAYNTHDTKLKYNLIASAVLVSNNTALTEGGGVYVNKGAALTQMTVVNNRCYGTGITVGGMQTGRAAGIYVRDNAHIVNSLLWGGKVSANNDIQYASSRSASDDNLKPLMQFTMLSKADHVDWSGTQKYKVDKLSDFNTLDDFEAAQALDPNLQKNESEAFPAFKSPSPSAGYIENVGLQTISNLDENGVPTNPSNLSTAPNKAYDWQVNARSAATHRGMLTYDLDVNHETPAQPTTHDILGDLYTARVTLGAYNSEAVSGLPYMYAEKNGTRYDYNFATERFENGSGVAQTIDDSWTVAATIFIDPSETDKSVSLGVKHSWDTPFKFLPDVLHFVKTMWVSSAYDKYFDRVDEINICVKEGTVNNTSSHYTGHVRNATIEIPHLKRKNDRKVQLNILGGFSKDLEGTDMSQRDPIHHPTIITGDLTDEYEMNASHLVTFNGCHDVLFDGFQLRYGNAKSTALGNTDQNGAAMYFKENVPIAGDDCGEPDGMAYKCCRIDVKNVLVAGCTAINGAAVYAVDNSRVNFENCIFHNNRAGAGSGNVRPDDTNGIVYAESGASLTLNHCDVLRNVGFAFAGQGSITLNNSVTYANMKNDTEDTNDKQANALKPTAQGTTLLGSNNLFDTQADDMGTVGTNTLSFHFDSATGGENYPRFINPTKNAGVSPKGDVTYYGRATSFEPTNTNPMVNAASFANADHTTWGKDMSDNTTRDFGGRPDIGAVENHKSENPEKENEYAQGQAAYGMLFYVKDYRDGSGNVDYSVEGDGTSWKSAINGNAYYHEKSGTFLGAEESKEITYDDIVQPYNTSYGAASTSYESSTIPNPIYYKIKNTSTNYYLKMNGKAVNQVSSVEDGDNFVISSDGKIFDATTSKYITWSGTDLVIQDNSPSSGWTINNGHINGSYLGFSRYWKVSNNSASLSYERNTNGNYTWNFVKVIRTPIGPPTIQPVTETVTGIRGLQYAVNKAGKLYKENHAKREVWVAAGTYKNKPIENEQACFLMQEGVDVYGGFPKTGNPGMDERKPLKSSSIYCENADGSKMTKAQTDAYETIIEPDYTNSVASGISVPYDVDYTGSVTASGLYSSSTNSCFRVLAQPKKHNPREFGTQSRDNNRFETQYYYDDSKDFKVLTTWDGFTIQKGFVSFGNERADGGAGARLWVNARLKNCIIQNNVNYQRSRSGREDARAGGVYMYGGKLEGCYIQKNLLGVHSGQTPNEIACYGAGIYASYASLFNCVIAHNLGRAGFANGAGITIESGEFYNNTVVYNTFEGDNRGCGGVYVWVGSSMKDAGFSGMTKIYNSIIYGNHGLKGTNNDTNFGNEDIYTQNGNVLVYGTFCNLAGSVADGNTHWKTNQTSTQMASFGSTVGVFFDSECYNLGTSNQGSTLFKDVSENSGRVEANTSNQNYRLSGNIGINHANDNPQLQSPIMPATNGWIGFGTDNNGAFTGGHYYSYPFTQSGWERDQASEVDANGRTYIVKSGTRYYLGPANFQLNMSDETIDLSEYTDMDFAERVQDCRSDAGAYEFNGSYSIEPDVTSETGKAIFYVTPGGYGTSSANSPENAACASKLQKVLDAAGRYKFAHPTTKVIVKVAASYAFAHNGDDSFDFKYTATRTTDHSDQNARVWSIIVPHGVEVWGGYSNAHVNAEGVKQSDNWSNTQNGFYSGSGVTYTDLRNVTKNPTYFDGEFTNRQENTVAHSYHTITFCDRVYDVDGYPYLKDDGNPTNGNLNPHSSYDKTMPPSEDGYLHMSDVALIGGEETRNHHRAIIDGIFVSGGNANADEGSNLLLSIGGAAVVTDFGHVRNCIILNNNAKKGGGLALANRGLVSGTLIVNNTAEQGGGIYSIPNGVTLANSTTNNTTNPPAGKAMDWNMPHVFTSTIVANSATKQGGGIFYSNENPNVRVNSCVIWNNDAPDQANVAGIVSPDKPTNDTNSTLAFYPFGYTAIQNLRASGTNNVLVQAEATRGVRFEGDNMEKFMQNYYGLTDYSVLARTGMPVGDYGALVSYYDMSSHDFADVDRNIDTKAPGTRTFIDMGARAVDKAIVRDQLMLRLFVAQVEDINMKIAEHLAGLAMLPKPQLSDAKYNLNNYDYATNEEKIAARDAELEEDIQNYNTLRYYSQEGSSFAYPMHSLQDALDYIYDARSIKGDGTLKWEDANNLPFEICVSKGTYYPTRDLAGNYGQSIANTFLIPEGVSIVGGFDCNGGGTSFYGAYDYIKPKGEWETPSITLDETGKYTTPTYYIFNNVTHGMMPMDTRVDVPGVGEIHITHESLALMKDHRNKEDINANNIIEPWEFLNETVLDGNAVNAENTGVYHILTAVADQNLVGALPTRSIERKAGYVNQFTDREEGQSINLNGLTVRGGQAFHFIEGALDEMSNYSYYHGGAFLIDGNRYNDNYNKTVADDAPVSGWSSDGKTRYMHQGVSNAVGYRDIPVAISQCKFVNNKAGYGGAISTNTTLDIFMSSFEQNLAEAHEEQVTHNSQKLTVAYPGQGGAVYSTHQFSAFNTIFANNEARDANYDTHGIKLTPFPTLRNQTPSTEILGGAGGAVYLGLQAQFHMVNCNIVRNMANAFPAVFTMNPNNSSQVTLTIQTPEYNQMVNTVAWGNEVNKTMQSKYNNSNEYFKFASGLICNYGNAGRTGAYSPTFTAGVMPKEQAELDNASNFEETVWFSAYEEGRGVTQNNTNDFRDVDYRPFIHGKLQLAAYAAAMDYSEGYQNCNISLSSENEDLEGPNFINPSREAGVAGYVESADWSPARLNKMTDNGTGKILQKIDVDPSKDFKYVSDFPTYEQAYPEKAAENYGLDPSCPNGRFYSIEGIDNVVTSGAYTMTRFLKDYRHYNENLPLGKEYYMESASTGQELLRISFDPNPTHNQTYIDIGVYEYPHTELAWDTDDECDILWVSAGEKPENGLPDGSDWSQPTSDLQRAIETLLASRNGHRKEIRLLDGTYTPIYTINGHLSFYIDTEYQNASVMLPMEDDPLNPGQKRRVEGLGIKSFTIKGGYSNDLENMYDLEQYPAIFRGQNRTNETDDNWDHLFYIKDATQRFGSATGYNDSNNNGWVRTGVATTEATVIPIEIDGVTFVNNQASIKQNGKPVDGAAIYYADQTFTSVGKWVENGTNAARAPLPANIRKVKQYWYDKARTRKADEPTMFAELPYEVPTSDPSFDQKQLKQNYVQIDHPAKFIMSKCKVMNSGTHYQPSQQVSTTSAVYIGKNGGESILFNNVFHSNWGNPLEAYGAKLINNTFALNQGFTKLYDYACYNNGYDGTNYNAPSVTDYTCSAFNNIFWRNGLAHAEIGTGKFKEFEFYSKTDAEHPKFGGYNVDLSTTGCENYFKRNAFSGGPTANTNYESTEDIATQQHYNVGLVKDNDNVIDGPNFTNPLDDDNVTYTNKEIESRDFTLQPSLRLVNKGDMTLYKSGVKYNVSNEAITNLDQTITIYDFAWLPTTAHDAASNHRKIANTDAGHIDLGAYEYQNQLERVIYVNPNAGMSGLGNTWADPIGKGYLQAAIDLAAVYCVNNDNEQAYVFVKGANVGEETHTGERITLRDGVQIFGGIDPGYNVDARALVTDAYTKAGIDNYIQTIKNTRLGVADPNGFKTRVSGIRTSSSTKFNNTGSTTTFADGFVVTPVGGVTPTEPAINIAPTKANLDDKFKIAVRNVIVSDFDLSGTPTANVANVNDALIYEALFRDNKVDGSMNVLNMGTNGYGVNLTVEGKTAGATENIFNSLINYGDDVKNTFSGYSYPLADKNLNYQLAEGSNQIDNCAATVPAGLPAGLQGFIDYAHDRDLLGNPRILALGTEATNTLDRGAFETWRVNENTEADTTPDNFGGNYYPHAGSVVYIAEGKSFVSAHEFEPGYLLVKKGASLYGNGFDVKAAYVAVERDVKEAGDVISLPFAMDYKSFDNDAKAGVATTSIAGNGVLTQDPFAGKNVYYYDGSERSAAGYDFANAGSPCWKDATGVRSACEGILYIPNSAQPKVRFTAKGSSMTDYIYTESGVSKSVTLTQYNHGNANTGNSADFTANEDMGWNAIGLPYLVSEYKPYEVTTESVHGAENNGKNLLHIPHTLWLYYDGKKDPNGNTVNGDGGFYSVNSWESTYDAWHVANTDADSDGDIDEARIWVGEGFFTQTATLDDSETLTFYRPVYTPAGGGTAKPMTRYYVTDGIQNIDLDSNGDAYIIDTQYFGTDGIQLEKPRRGVTIVRDIYSDGTTRSRKIHRK